ncbi:hypothetical conserved protein (plasmid) [Rhizobium etli CFN 42]|uniref:Hypothetical conserved protein n=1 Tax=Rhizobium etli (strain ATCC 51251 / DSM 11541 / JCM 21823 / NBRC 15573 / CFN 42) TaxID=347834 RepID=Q2K1F5_RHIEC|nr:hypothetical protein [Rhizobium etli]ABC93315.1 hypothetical conserved protein [Rhizobium etli CFN 42]
MPKSLLGFVLLISRYIRWRLQPYPSFFFLAGTAPLEIQRRIINAATERGSYRAILILVLAYLGLVLLEGLTKLMLNVYRGWVGEIAVRWLRKSALAASQRSEEAPLDALAEGVQLSIIIAEAEPVGGFVGTSISGAAVAGWDSGRRRLLFDLPAATDGACRRRRLPAADRLRAADAIGDQPPGEDKDHRDATCEPKHGPACRYR